MLSWKLNERAEKKRAQVMLVQERGTRHRPVARRREQPVGAAPELVAAAQPGTAAGRRAASPGAKAALELPSEAASVRGAGLEPRASTVRLRVVSTPEVLPQRARPSEEPVSVEPRLEAQRPEERQEVEQVLVPSSGPSRESGARARVSQGTDALVSALRAS